MKGAAPRRALPVLAVAGAVALAGCNVMKAPWQPRAPSAGDEARGDTTATGGTSAPADSAADAAPAEERGERPREISSEAAEAMRAAVGGGDTAGRRGRPDSLAPDPRAEPPSTVEGLEAAGPTFVRYDEGPRLRRSDELAALLEALLLPVIEEQGLSPRSASLFWVLVSETGGVADIVLHTTSGSDEFDEAAAGVARSLTYRPARRDGEPVPVWVLARVHLLMR